LFVNDGPQYVMFGHSDGKRLLKQVGIKRCVEGKGKGVVEVGG